MQNNLIFIHRSYTGGISWVDCHPTLLKRRKYVKKKEITNSDLVKIEPVTDNQKVVFDSYKKGKNQFLYGCAGTGKTFISLYLAMQEV